MACGGAPRSHAPGMRNLVQKLLLAVLLVGTASACSSTYRTRPYGYGYARVVYEAPPAPHDYYYEDRPGYVYVQGRWVWDGGDWRWIDGRYVRARRGYVYHQGYWDQDGGRYVWRPGRWERHRPGYVYSRGYYDYDGRSYRYRPGRWERDRGADYRWIEGRWVRRGGRQVWVPGHWEERRGRRIYTSPRGR